MNFSIYDIDREAVITRAREAGVGMIVVGTDLSSSKMAIELAEKYENVWATVGVHPTDDVVSKSRCAEEAGVSFFDYGAFKSLAVHPKVVAIGECGLDYHHKESVAGEPLDIEAQRSLFLEHIKLANDVNKPLMLHVRNAQLSKNGDKSSDAYKEAVSILRQYAKVRANFHFFAGDTDDLSAILSIKGMVSFTGVITFTSDYDELIKLVPIDSLMTETDCPYVSPVPFRGKRNEPVFVIEVVKAITKIRSRLAGQVKSATDTSGMTSEISRQLLDNARSFFGLAE